ncbi:para-aminobenzoate synthase component II [Salmonella enterica subsp. enterica]|nr:para-aminobenzoate synthase component II [Salmonella enterica subsp. enterica]
MILLIDNYDSFTWNLYQYFCELGAEVQVRRNDALTLAHIDALNPQKIVISPGPCTPNDAGISLAVIRHYAGRIPMLGVCLGHQAMAQAFGASVVRAAKVMHGKTSPVTHNGQGVFRGLPSPLTVTRYHSLIVDPATLPECFEITGLERNAGDYGHSPPRVGSGRRAVPPGKYSQRTRTRSAEKFPPALICGCY